MLAYIYAHTVGFCGMAAPTSRTSCFTSYTCLRGQNWTLFCSQQSAAKKPALLACHSPAESITDTSAVLNFLSVQKKETSSPRCHGLASHLHHNQKHGIAPDVVTNLNNSRHTAEHPA